MHITRSFPFFYSGSAFKPQPPPETPTPVVNLLPKKRTKSMLMNKQRGLSHVANNFISFVSLLERFRELNVSDYTFIIM